MPAFDINKLPQMDNPLFKNTFLTAAVKFPIIYHNYIMREDNGMYEYL
jgi:hypothetical protein